MSGGRVLHRPAATEDVIAAARSIALDNPAAANRFIDAVRATEYMLLANPHMGAPRDFDHPLLAGIRFHLVRGFRKYLVFYLPLPDGIEVVRVLHGSRDVEALFEHS